MVVKEVVFFFSKFFGVDILLGLEMCFIGEVMGIDSDFGKVFVKVELGVGVILVIIGMVFVFMSDCIKEVVVFVVWELIDLGFKVVVIFGI